MSWTPSENRTILQLEADGFGPIEARIITAMASRRYARDTPKLIDVLSGHVGLEDTLLVSASLQSLLNRSVLTHISYNGRHLTAIDPNYAERLRATNYAKSAEVLEALQASPIGRFKSLGQMTDNHILETFTEAVLSAQRIIRIAFFASLADIEGIEALHGRAQAGVEVRILLGSPQVMEQLRGRSHRKRAVRAIDSWRAKTHDWPNTSVRLATQVRDIEYGSSLSVDGRLLRFDLHEPLAERSLLGEMLLVHETGGNLIRMFDATFDDAWHRAFPTKTVARLWKRLIDWKWSVATVAAVCWTLALPGSGWREIVAGVAVTCFFAALDENKDRIKMYWRRLRHGN